MTTENGTTQAAKKIEAFYSNKPLEGRPEPVPVSLWISDSSAPNAPDFDGKIGDRRVTLRIRSGSNGGFLSVSQSVKTAENGADGKPIYKDEQIGTANIRVTSKGYPSLAIRLDANKEETIWANVSKSAPENLLVRAGLDLAILAQKRAAAGLN